MALLLGVLRDKRGNILPNTPILARQRGYISPLGDYAGPINSDADGSFRLTVTNTATEYNIFVNNEAGDISGPNFVGTLFSSGNSVTSFVLLDDTDWKIEHYGNGEAQTAGTHKSINVDDMTLRTGGFVETTDSFFELRISATTSKLRITRIISPANTYWLDPYPEAGVLNADVGLKEGYDSSVRYFYFGINRTFNITTAGNFRLNGGRFDAAVTFYGTTAFDDAATFNIPNGYPKLDTYLVPLGDTYFAPKKYVDDQVAGAIGSYMHRDYSIPNLVEYPEYSYDVDVSAPYVEPIDNVPYMKITGNDDDQSMGISYFFIARKEFFDNIKLRYKVETEYDSVDFFVFDTDGNLIESNLGNQSAVLEEIVFDSATIQGTSLTEGSKFKILAQGNVNNGTSVYISDCSIEYQ